MSIHDNVADKIETATAFARDGAFATAARLLREASEIYSEHNDWINRQMFGSQLPPAMATAKAREGVEHLQRARRAFSISDNRQTLARVRSTISSARGAIRICQNREIRERTS